MKKLFPFKIVSKRNYLYLNSEIVRLGMDNMQLRKDIYTLVMKEGKVDADTVACGYRVQFQSMEQLIYGNSEGNMKGIFDYIYKPNQK
jgi:hypothetical protein